MRAHTWAWRAVPAAARIARQWRVGDFRGVPEIVRRGATLAGVVLAAARSRPDAVLLVDEDGPVRGAELASAVSAVRQQLSAAIGQDHQRELALCTGSHRGFVAAATAAGVLGLDAVVLPPHAGHATLARVLADVDVAVVDPNTAGQVRASAPHVQLIDCTNSGARSARGSAGSLPRARRTGELRLLTSGTTGTPTVTRRSGAGLGQLPTVLSLMAALGLRRHEPVLLAPSLSHGHGLSVLIAALVVGAPAVLAHGQDGAGLLERLRVHRAGVLAVVPAQLARLLEAVRVDAAQAGRRHAGAGSAAAPRADREDLSFLRRVAAGSARLSPELAAGVWDVLGAEPVDFYGTSEAGTATIATPEDLRETPGTVGRPAAGVRVEIVDRRGRRLPPEVVGRVRVSSPWRASARIDGQLVGDLGHLDRQGRLFLHGRADDVVVVGGHNVSIEEVRAWFATQPGVHHAQVNAIAHHRLGHELEVLVSGDADPTELRERARADLGSATAPRRVELTRD